MRTADEVRVHFIEADLSMAEPWEELADEDVLEGFAELLGKHLAFLRFLEAREGA